MQANALKKKIEDALSQALSLAGEKDVEAAVDILRQQIEKGDNRLRVLSDLCRAKAIRIKQPDLIRMVSNINTGEEFDRILNRYNPQ